MRRFAQVPHVLLFAGLAVGCDPGGSVAPDAAEGPTLKRVKMRDGRIRNDGIVITDRAGVPVATKRVTVLWRYSDVNGDGVFTWGGPSEGGDVFRLVNRAIYDFTADFTPAADWDGTLATFFWGPAGPAAGAFRPSVFRGVGHDDFIPGLPVPGDFIVTQGEDGPPVPGLSLTGQLFIDTGDWDPNNGLTPLTAPRWGIRYTLSFAPGTPRVIPAGTHMFMDSQLDMRNIANDACESGWSEEDRIATGAGGFTQPGPNTAAPDLARFPKLEVVPLLFAPAGHPCAGP